MIPSYNTVNLEIFPEEETSKAKKKVQSRLRGVFPMMMHSSLGRITQIKKPLSNPRRTMSFGQFCADFTSEVNDHITQTQTRVWKNEHDLGLGSDVSGDFLWNIEEAMKVDEIQTSILQKESEGMGETVKSELTPKLTHLSRQLDDLLSFITTQRQTFRINDLNQTIDSASKSSLKRFKDLVIRIKAVNQRERDLQALVDGLDGTQVLRNRLKGIEKNIRAIIPNAQDPTYLIRTRTSISNHVQEVLNEFTTTKKSLNESLTKLCAKYKKRILKFDQNYPDIEDAVKKRKDELREWVQLNKKLAKIANSKGEYIDELQSLDGRISLLGQKCEELDMIYHEKGKDCARLIESYDCVTVQMLSEVLEEISSIPYTETDIRDELNDCLKNLAKINRESEADMSKLEGKVTLVESKIRGLLQQREQITRMETMLGDLERRLDLIESGKHKDLTLATVSISKGQTQAPEPKDRANIKVIPKSNDSSLKSAEVSAKERREIDSIQLKMPKHVTEEEPKKSVTFMPMPGQQTRKQENSTLNVPNKQRTESKPVVKPHEKIVGKSKEQKTEDEMKAEPFGKAKDSKEATKQKEVLEPSQKIEEPKVPKSRKKLATQDDEPQPQKRTKNESKPQSEEPVQEEVQKPQRRPQKVQDKPPELQKNETNRKDTKKQNEPKQPKPKEDEPAETKQPKEAEDTPKRERNEDQPEPEQERKAESHRQNEEPKPRENTEPNKRQEPQKPSDEQNEPPGAQKEESPSKPKNSQQSDGKTLKKEGRVLRLKTKPKVPQFNRLFK